ncbi:MAG: ABC transporter permease [Flavobacteriales bacterium]|nr:ABC transporter permease [Flavobacteriales bacterium]
MAKSKIGLIIKHEYLTRVRKKSFWLVGILTPLAIVAVGAIIGLLSVANEKQETQVGVYDLSGRISSNIEGRENLKFIPISTSLDLDSVKNMIRTTESIKGVLVIPEDTSATYASVEKGMIMYYSENVPMDIQSDISKQVGRLIQDTKIQSLGVDPKILAQTKTDVNISMVDISAQEEKTESDLVQGVKIALAFTLCFMLYMFMVFSGNMVMTSTLEEKTNRIVEVIVSSVRPFDLMVGKIISSGMVAITQLAIWAVMLTVLSLVGVVGVSSFVASKNADKITEMTAQMSENASPEMAQAVQMSQNSDVMAKVTEVMTDLSQIDFISIGIVSLVFFLLGYLLYASLYAAVGAAVDSPNDAGQFVLPLTIPILIALYCGMTIINNPNGPVAFWLSMIPLTSPVVMMVRIPFGVPAWEIVLSAVLLLVTFLIFTWMAAKIYRVGLLMYGTKPTYKDLWKWIRQS